MLIPFYQQYCEIHHQKVDPPTATTAASAGFAATSASTAAHAPSWIKDLRVGNKKLAHIAPVAVWDWPLRLLKKLLLLCASGIFSILSAALLISSVSDMIIWTPLKSLYDISPES